MKNSFHQRYIFSNHFKWSDKQKDHSTRVDHGSRDEIGRRKVGETNSEDVPRLVLIEQHSGLDFEMDDDKIHRVLDDRHEDRGDQYPRCGPRRPGIDSRTVVRRVSRQPISHRTLPAPAPPKVVSFSARSTTSGGCTTIKSSNWVGPPPPVIHRITSSPTRPALSYERIGHPSSGIFRMSLPQSLLDDGRLDAVITLAEDYINTTRHGSWTTELYSLTRQDIAMRQIPGMKTLIDPIVDMLTRTIESMYGCRKVLMDRNQPHMLKYSMDSAHTGVQLHQDRCDVTVNLVLSRSDEYEGGGTYFPETDGKVIRMEQGDFLLHPGSLLHGGMDIKQGTRFLMILFAHLRYDCE